MTFGELKKSASTFRPAFWYDDFINGNLRGIIRLGLAFATIAVFVVGSEVFSEGTSWILPLFYFSLAALLLLVAFETYYNSFRFGKLEDGMSFELATIVRSTSESDLVAGYVASAFGSSALARLGIAESDIAVFLSSRNSPLTADTFSFPGDKISMADYAASLFKLDGEFRDFLFKQGVLDEDWDGVISWLVRDIKRSKEKKEWWSKRNLSKIQGLGKAWSYGQAWLLEKYGREAYAAYDLSAINVNASYHSAEVEELEVVLSRASEANALLVAEGGSGAADVVARFAKEVSLGMVHPAIEHKRIFVLDTNQLVASLGDKNAFEAEIIRLMEHADGAGNIIIVIPDLVAFIANARTLGSDVISILDPYLMSSKTQVIAIAESMGFHQALESNPIVSERFERILVKSGTNEETMRLLEDRVPRFERQSGLFFTYPSLQAIAESADRYITTGTMPDKAIDLLIEAVPSMAAQKRSVVTKQDIMSLVESKTGIPVAGLKGEEKERLMKLEEILHKRVIGQDVAVEAIATAMRRARSGVSNPNRPIGSFLFLGPTGVGKTETTKALAEAFFGDEQKVLRLDMSEYSQPDALSRLIGSFETGKAGTLTSMLRDNPYGVLLLDEFEKANKEVHNLFLQVLDEGVFSDMVGRKVNARNLIIIATSNAGAQMIWELSQKDGLSGAKDMIIDSIIRDGVYKPELLNRFDGVILFHPLREVHLRKISELMLKKLKSRLEERRINLKVTDALVDYLVRQGSDPKFGARPLNRAIQEKIESFIAKKIIDGSIPPGGEVELTQADFA